jgi:hypothetical protein
VGEGRRVEDDKVIMDQDARTKNISRLRKNWISFPAF